jgi:FtsH-binding integral membrane protein
MPEQPELTFLVAVHRYWKNLVGVALLPSLLCIAALYSHWPKEIMALVFVVALIVVAVIAALAWLTGKAPYALWKIACMTWVGRWLLAVLVNYVLKAVLG